MVEEAASTLEVRLSDSKTAPRHVARTYVSRSPLAEGDPVTIRVRLCEPGDASAGTIRTFVVPFHKDMRIIDALHALSDQGESIAYRWFCSTKKCGGCGMKVNGEPKLVCWEAVDQATLLLEPLDNFKPVRDLVVDRTEYQSRYLAMKPYVERKVTPPFPEPLTHKQMAGSYKLMDCIECGICTSVCPSYTGVDGTFPGPWALVQAAKFARDPRDELDRGALIESSGADHCMSCYRCEQVCPLSIPIVAEAIEPLRGMAARGPAGRASFPLAFAENVRRNVYVHTASLFVHTRGLLESLRSIPMALRLLAMGKTRLAGNASHGAKAAIAAIFREAGQEER